jgi:hypothetical protein
MFTCVDYLMVIILFVPNWHKSILLTGDAIPGKNVQHPKKNQYSMIEVLIAKISSILYCILKYILQKMYDVEKKIVPNWPIQV